MQQQIHTLLFNYNFAAYPCQRITSQKIIFVGSTDKKSFVEIFL